MTVLGIDLRARRWALAAGLCALVVVALAVAITDRVMHDRALSEQAGLARNDAAILASSLRSELDKFSLLPIALADDPQVRALAAGDGASVAALNGRLEALARQSAAAAIYVMRADGTTLAASNWRLPTSFVGSKYAFRRYFHDALANGSATQFALGTVSREPGLYIARRICTRAAPLGVVAVKVEFDGLERSWRDTAQRVYVTDRDGVVLLASDERWRFHLAQGASADARDAEADLRQFGIRTLRPLAIVSPNEGEAVRIPLLDTRQPILPDGWVLHLLADPAQRVDAAVATGRLALALGFLVLAVLAATGVVMRRRRDARAQALLDERTRTLREQLSQANRLATLGQISAGVGHEIGQPVAATRVLAENGQKMLAAGEVEQASGNFARIVDLADRIGRITGELRRFSRRQPADRREMPLGEAIDGALLLLRDRIRSMHVAIDLPPEEATQVVVAAEHVRLEQVLVNLLQNALDAAGEGGRVTVAVDAGGDAVCLRVIDSGTPLSLAQADDLFRPFATTKPDGLGLGLVIARDIMRDLGGELAYDADASATTFVMTIPRA